MAAANSGSVGKGKTKHWTDDHIHAHGEIQGETIWASYDEAGLVHDISLSKTWLRDGLEEYGKWLQGGGKS